MNPYLAILRLIWKPLLALAVIGGVYGYWHHLVSAREAAEARAVAAEQRADRAEKQAKLDTTAATLGAAREVTIATTAPEPVVRTRLVRVCEQPAVPVVRSASASSVEPATPPANTRDRQPDLDGLAADLQACRANNATLEASLKLIDLIYASNATQ